MAQMTEVTHHSGLGGVFTGTGSGDTHADSDKIDRPLIQKNKLIIKPYFESLLFKQMQAFSHFLGYA